MSEPIPSSPNVSSWWQFSLRAFFVVVTLAAVGLGWYVNRGRRQQAAVQALRAIGAEIIYEDQLRSHCQFPAMGMTGSMHRAWQNATGRSLDYEPDSYEENGEVVEFAPPWYYRWLGQDYFRTVFQVDFGPCEYDDLSSPNAEALRSLSDLPGLKRVILDPHWLGPPRGVPDADLAELRGLKSLERLFLRRREFSDDGLAHLAGLTNLRYLSLDGTAITDRGLVHLRGLTELEFLELSGTQVTDAGMESLRGLTKAVIQVGFTKVTPECRERFNARGTPTLRGFSP